MATENKQSHTKRLKGTVVSNKMQKTIVVEVSRFVKHKKYGKYMKIDKRMKAHVEGAMPEVGAIVTIEETRPMSRDKHFKLVA
ncbi:30S ribosomal protein S17 [Candidatus Parcubacteria bacterium]|nr:30S ribosomal protein S17 [Candidatus Parcubacteria bacterium]